MWNDLILFAGLFVQMAPFSISDWLFLWIRYLNGVTDGMYDCAHDMGCQIPLQLGQHGHQEVKFFHVAKKGVDWVFVDHPCYHRSGGPYGDELGVFGDNLLRYYLQNAQRVIFAYLHS